MSETYRKNDDDLIRYDIIINTGIDEEGDIEIFLQQCIWSRKPYNQTAYYFSRYGISDEYTIYTCDLSGEDLTVLLLKFSGTVTVIGQDPQVYRSNDELFKLAFGEPYLHSPEARHERMQLYFQSLLAP
jgi:hypothetical protein